MNRSRIPIVLLSLVLCCPLYVLAEPAITLPGEKDYGENCVYEAEEKYDAEIKCEGEDCLRALVNGAPS